jgi:hypothetical protein
LARHPASSSGPPGSDIAKDSTLILRRTAVLTPAESAEALKQEHEVVFLENFFDYLRQRVPLGK